MLPQMENLTNAPVKADGPTAQAGIVTYSYYFVIVDLASVVMNHDHRNGGRMKEGRNGVSSCRSF